MALMILLLVVGLPVLEIYVLVQVGGRIGLVNTVFALVAAGVLGAGLAKAQGRFIQQRLQQAIALGQMPTTQVVHGVLVFVGGVLFLIPGFVSDVIGLFFILPGTRHLVAWVIHRKLERQFSSGQFRVFSTGMGGFGAGGGFTTSGFRNARPFDRQGSFADGDQDFGRDVTPKVIDVTPVSKEESDRDRGDSGGSAPAN